MVKRRDRQNKGKKNILSKNKSLKKDNIYLKGKHKHTTLHLHHVLNILNANKHFSPTVASRLRGSRDPIVGGAVPQSRGRARARAVRGGGARAGAAARARGARAPPAGGARAARQGGRALRGGGGLWELILMMFS